MMRRSAVVAVGGYRKAFDYAEDHDLWLRMSENGRLTNLPKILVHYRVHGNNVTNRHNRRQAFHAEVAGLAAIRRRAGKGDPTAGAEILDRTVLDALELDDAERARMSVMLAEAVREDRERAAAAGNDYDRPLGFFSSSRKSDRRQR